jgi:hypothetical protein
MEDKIVLKGHIEKKQHVLSKPEFYEKTPMVCLIIPRDYVQGLVAFTTERPHATWEVTITPWPENITERAWNFFFALRDRVAKAQGDTSSENKDHLYRSCLAEMCSAEGQELKQSIKDLTKKELWKSTEIMYEWALEAEAYIIDLIPEYKGLKKEIKE